MIQKGDILKTSGIAGVNRCYDLLIPGYLNPTLQQFYQQAKTFAGNSVQQQRVAAFLTYVHHEITPNLAWNDVGKLVPLQRALYKREGVCKEKAATLDMLLTLDGFVSEYKRGIYQSERHAWLKVEIAGTKYLADPTTPLFGKYASVLKTNGFEEGENIILRNGVML